MLHLRLISGTLLIAAALGLFWLDSYLDTVKLAGFWQSLFPGRTAPTPGLVILALALGLLPLCAYELRNVFRANQVHTSGFLIAAASIVTALTMYVTPIHLRAPTGVVIVASVFVSCFIVTLIWHSRHAEVKGAVAAAGATMFAATYLGLMGGFYLAIRRDHAAWVVLGIIFITKAGDTGAFFTGRAIGKHKLIPWLSPKKTWEGLAGGVVLASLLGAAFAWLTQETELAAVYRTVNGEYVRAVRSYDVAWGAVAGAFLAIVGHVGDLTMSLFKRDAGLKDSGNMVPGIGGILDLMDSPLLVAPVAYWMLELAARN